jgi:protein SCO1/2
VSGRVFSRTALAFFAAFALDTMSAGALADAVPPVDRVAFAPAPDAHLPLDARFVDEHGRTLALGELFESRPAIVVPAYYGCSNLCGVVLHAVAAGIEAAGLRAGEDVDIVAVSIDPADTPATALARKRATAPGPGAGWHFLTGEPRDIERFTGALGYRYAYDSAARQYAHASGIAILAPGGRISRVLYGVAFAPADLRKAIAATGSRAEPAESGQPRTWLLCFHYDPRTGRYSFAAMTAVRAAGLLSLLGLGGYVAVASRRRERGRP